VQLVHAHQLDPGAGGGNTDRVDDVGDVHPAGELQAEEAANSMASIRAVAAGGTVTVLSG
jgi:hypothetical protein